jgi:2'-5' RNA ligase
MPFAVSVWFDETTDREIRALWRVMADEGVSRFLHDGPFRPHLTLALYEELEVSAVVAALRPLAEQQEGFSIPLASIGVFPGAEGVVFLAATRTPLLDALHRRVHERLADFATGPHAYYLPERWNPHCTIALGITASDVVRAVDILWRRFTEREAPVRRLALIETPAEREIGFWNLQGERNAGGIVC